MTSKEALKILDEIGIKDNILGGIKKDLEQLEHTRAQLQKVRKEKRRWKNKYLQQKEVLEILKSKKMYIQCIQSEYETKPKIYNNNEMFCGYYLTKQEIKLIEGVKDNKKDND